MSKSNIILINGGGWMGDVYPEDEGVIQHVAENFPENKIVIMPQTIFYAEPGCDQSRVLLQRGNEVFSSASDLSLCLREERSFHLAEEIYPNVASYLVPDMALAYCSEVVKGTGKTNRVGVCLRADKERSLDDRSIGMVMRALKDSGKEVVPVTTMAGRKVYSSERREVVEEKLKEFSECDLIITDRLHAMLFSFLANTPCVAFDNSTRKVSGVFNAWLYSQPLVRLLAEPDQLTDVLAISEAPIGGNETRAPRFDYEILKELMDDE